MARHLSNNVANQLTFGVAGLRSILEGLSAVSFHAAINVQSVVGSTQNDNPICMVLFSGTSVAFSLNIDARVGGPNIAINGRSTAGDTRRAARGATVLALSTWYRVGGYLDYANDLAQVFLDGTPDVAATAAAFANTTLTYTSAPTSPDSLGSWSPGTAANYANIYCAEAAFYAGRLTDRQFRALGTRRDPLRVARTSLLGHWTLLGNQSPEPNSLRGGVVGTITGSVPKVRHPRVIY